MHAPKRGGVEALGTKKRGASVVGGKRAVRALYVTKRQGLEIVLSAKRNVRQGRMQVVLLAVVNQAPLKKRCREMGEDTMVPLRHVCEGGAVRSSHTHGVTFLL